MDSRKISFGFSKTAKKSNLLPTNKIKEKEEPKVELIKCLEGQEIKLLEEKKEEPPMVIPLKENTKTSAALASLIKRRAVLLGESIDTPPDESIGKMNTTATNGKSEKAIESLDERAARELLFSVQANDNKYVDQNLVLPTLNADELPLEGAKQSSIDDYENVPIEQFGKAMLRGMGWVEPIQKKGSPSEDEMPFVRPKGMGLGADKALAKQPLLIAPEKNEVLEIKKQAFVRILGGKHKDMYGQIEGFDDHAGRVIVKMAIGGAKEAFNEFLCQPVSKKEYVQYGKCINAAKYEEYKKMENEHRQIIIKQEDKINKPHPAKEDRNVKDEGGKHLLENKDRDRRIERRRIEDDRQRSRCHALDEQHSGSSRRDRYNEHRNERDLMKRRSRERNSRAENERMPSASGSSSRRQQYTDDTSASSGTDSDSDSAYERKTKKKSSHKSKAKKKSSKKSKRKHRQRTSDTETSSKSDTEGEQDSYRREKKQHKKKTKKSKKPRSRSRSHDRSNRR